MYVTCYQKIIENDFMLKKSKTLETFIVLKVSLFIFVVYLELMFMKEQIIERASDLFLNLGFKSVTMDDLASEMGISKKTIYTHFSNKTKLVEATTNHIFQVISDGIDSILEEEKDIM